MRIKKYGKMVFIFLIIKIKNRSFFLCNFRVFSFGFLKLYFLYEKFFFQELNEEGNCDLMCEKKTFLSSYTLKERK